MADGTERSPEPERVQVLRTEPRARRAVVRMAVLYTPLTIAMVVLAAIALFNLLNGAFAAVIGVVIFGIISFATGYQAWTALRDLRAEPVRTRGIVDRAWDKGTVLWITRAHYALVRSPLPGDAERFARRVFVLPEDVYREIAEGGEVEIDHLPHTNTVLRFAAVKRPSRPAPRRRQSRPTR